MRRMAVLLIFISGILIAGSLCRGQEEQTGKGGKQEQLDEKLKLTADDLTGTKL